MNPDYVLLDLVLSAKGWDTVKDLYLDDFVISTGKFVPDGTFLPGGIPSEDDISLLLERATVLIADTDRYKDLALEAKVRFFKVE